MILCFCECLFGGVCCCHICFVSLFCSLLFAVCFGLVFIGFYWGFRVLFVSCLCCLFVLFLFVCGERDGGAFIPLIKVIF